MGVTLLAAISVGETQLFEVAHSMLPPSGQVDERVAAGDLDGDGDVDLVLGHRVLLNDGLGRFEAREGPALSGKGIALGDLDGDGDLDALSAEGPPGGGFECFGQPLTLLLNDGSGAFATAGTLSGWTCGTSIGLADIDLDGDLDAVVNNGGYAGSPRLYLNDGAAHFTEESQRLPSIQAALVAFGDADGDGDPDLFFGSHVGSILFNDGGGRFSLHVGSLPAPSQYAYGGSFADLDSDGDLDLVEATYGTEVALRNDGNGYFTRIVEAFPETTDDSFSVAVGDVDGDLDQDVIVGSTDRARLYKNDGGGLFSLLPDSYFPALGLPGASYGSGQVAFLEADQDGDEDALILRSADLYTGQARLLLNSGAGRFVDTTPRVADVGLVLFIEPADVDLDGDLGVLAGTVGPNGWARLFLREADGSYSDASASIPPLPYPFARARAGDVDADGDADFVLVQGIAPATIVRLWLGDGSGAFVEDLSMAPQVAASYSDAGLADLDADGDLDLVLAVYSSGPACLYLNDGTGAFVGPDQGLPPSVLSSHCVRPADVDGDGDLDLFFGGANRIYFNDGSAHFVEGPVVAGGWKEADWGDVDGDGDVDLLAVGGTSVTLQLNDGAGHLTDASSQIACCLNQVQDATLVDVDQDGDLDARVSAFSHSVQFRLNDGSGHFSTGAIDLPGSYNSSHCFFADLDGDADLDAFGAASGLLRVWSNTTRHVAWRQTPRIAKPFGFDVRGPAYTSWRLLGARLEGSTSTPFRTLGLEPGSVYHSSSGTLDAQGRAFVRIDVPADPSLVGVTAYWQAFVGDPLRLSNLERTTFSNL